MARSIPSPTNWNLSVPEVPTEDGRVKPDLSAPGMTSSETASGGHFGGTSAACAHAAGFAALLRQIEPGFGADRLRGRLLAAVRPRGTPQPNNNFGYGEINAGAMKAQPTDSLLDYLSTEAGKTSGRRIAVEPQPPPGHLSGRLRGAVINHPFGSVLLPAIPSRCFGALFLGVFYGLACQPHVVCRGALHVRQSRRTSGPPDCFDRGNGRPPLEACGPLPAPCWCT